MARVAALEGGWKPSFEPQRVELDGGVVKSSHRTGAFGRILNLNEYGTFRFFVTVVAKDGAELGMWAGAEYEEAIRQAEATRVDFGIDEPVHDLVAGSA